MTRARRAMRWILYAAGALLVAGLVAPLIHADRFSKQIQPAVERAIGRHIEFEKITFTLLAGPGFALHEVVIHEDPEIGLEPIAYVDTLRAGIRLWSLWTGKLEFNSIALEEPSINLAKAPGDGGAWNFERLLRRADLAAFPTVSVRDGRINFKFGENKSTLYLMNADADLWPPSKRGGPWSIRFEGAPARTDRRSRGFGSLQARGSWTPAGKINMDLRLDRNAIADVTSLLQGQDAGVHGDLSATVHLAGPLHDVQISGNATLEDIHRWDMLPPDTAGWPFQLKGRLNMETQQLDVEAAPGIEGIPVTARLRASQYLSSPHWGVSLTWNRFPVAPLLELARHMGVRLPGEMKAGGWVEGVVGYSGSGGMQGELGFVEATVEMPGSSPLRFDQAHVVFEGNDVSLRPSIVRTEEDQQASLSGRWTRQTGAWDFRISTASMDVGALRAQAALAAVPWIEQLESGNWSGDLRYRVDPQEETNSGWSGRVSVREGVLTSPGIADPIHLEQAQATIDGPRVALDRMRIRAGKLAANGDYLYEPGALRPHRLRLAMAAAGSAELERVLRPALQRRRGLLARALRFGRAPVPSWLAEMKADVNLSIESLAVGNTALENVHARLLWDATEIRIADLRALAGDAHVTAGGGTISLLGGSPVYRLFAKWTDLPWQAGAMSGESILQTSGAGMELLANLRSSGVFHGYGLELPADGESATVRGAYEMRWTAAGPHVRLAGLRVSMPGGTYTGRGGTAGDGRLVVELASGLRELRMSGTLARLNVDVVPPVP